MRFCICPQAGQAFTFPLMKSKQKSTAAEKISKNRIIQLKPGTRPFSLSSYAGPDFFGTEPNVPQTCQFF